MADSKVTIDPEEWSLERAPEHAIDCGRVYCQHSEIAGLRAQLAVSEARAHLAVSEARACLISDEREAAMNARDEARAQLAAARTEHEASEDEDGAEINALRRECGDLRSQLEAVRAELARAAEGERLLRDALKYVVEDRAVTPGVTRLERWTTRARKHLESKP